MQLFHWVLNVKERIMLSSACQLHARHPLVCLAVLVVYRLLWEVA